MFLEGNSEDGNVETHDVLESHLSSPTDTQSLVNPTQEIDSLDIVTLAGSVIDLRSLHHGPLSIDPPRPRRAVRSVEARKRRNRKRNLALRSLRDQHVLLRPLYYRFNIRQIKKILREREVRYIHLKLDKRSNCLSIDVTKSELIERYFDLIPGNLFDRDHYHLFLKHRS